LDSYTQSDIDPHDEWPKMAKIQVCSKRASVAFGQHSGRCRRIV
jgi:hypothetical protein